MSSAAVNVPTMVSAVFEHFDQDRDGSLQYHEVEHMMAVAHPDDAFTPDIYTELCGEMFAEPEEGWQEGQVRAYFDGQEDVLYAVYGQVCAAGTGVRNLPAQEPANPGAMTGHAHAMPPSQVSCGTSARLITPMSGSGTSTPTAATAYASKPCDMHGIPARLPSVPVPAMVSAVFEHFDQDRDGSLQYHEVEHMMAVAHPDDTFTPDIYTELCGEMFAEPEEGWQEGQVRAYFDGQEDVLHALYEQVLFPSPATAVAQGLPGQWNPASCGDATRGPAASSVVQHPSSRARHSVPRVHESAVYSPAATMDVLPEPERGQPGDTASPAALAKFRQSKLSSPVGAWASPPDDRESAVGVLETTMNGKLPTTPNTSLQKLPAAPAAPPAPKSTASVLRDDLRKPPTMPVADASNAGPTLSSPGWGVGSGQGGGTGAGPASGMLHPMPSTFRAPSEEHQAVKAASVASCITQEELEASLAEASVATWQSGKGSDLPKSANTPSKSAGRKLSASSRASSRGMWATSVHTAPEHTRSVQPGHARKLHPQPVKRNPLMDDEPALPPDAPLATLHSVRVVKRNPQDPLGLEFSSEEPLVLKDVQTGSAAKQSGVGLYRGYTLAAVNGVCVPKVEDCRRQAADFDSVVLDFTGPPPAAPDGLPYMPPEDRTTYERACEIGLHGDTGRDYLQQNPAAVAGRQPAAPVEDVAGGRVSIAAAVSPCYDAGRTPSAAQMSPLGEYTVRCSRHVVDVGTDKTGSALPAAVQKDALPQRCSSSEVALIETNHRCMSPPRRPRRADLGLRSSATMWQESPERHTPPEGTSQRPIASSQLLHPICSTASCEPTGNTLASPSATSAHGLGQRPLLSSEPRPPHRTAATFFDAQPNQCEPTSASSAHSAGEVPKRSAAAVPAPAHPTAVTFPKVPDQHAAPARGYLGIFPQARRAALGRTSSHVLSPTTPQGRLAECGRPSESMGLPQQAALTVDAGEAEGRRRVRDEEIIERTGLIGIGVASITASMAAASRASVIPRADAPGRAPGRKWVRVNGTEAWDAQWVESDVANVTRPQTSRQKSFL